MSMTTYEERRTIPSVFSDIPTRDDVARSREDAERARKRIGALGIWIVLLVGAAIVAIGLAGVAGYLYQQKDHDLTVLQEAYTDLDNASGDLRPLRTQREDVQTRRRALLDRLATSSWSVRQRDLAWQAARAQGFVAAREGTREANEPSQAWPALNTQAGQGLQAEVQMLANATAAVERTVVTQTPVAPTPICPDPRQDDCGR
jgi:hypothetical protein